ncbi:myelin basic protein isoform X2 [Paroedura picta]|uniref:myelin basic protein isoform X2 n=1 Tax=Paroedura picta TaxID=143630 RepID=UPI0040575370
MPLSSPGSIRQSFPTWIWQPYPRVPPVAGGEQRPGTLSGLHPVENKNGFHHCRRRILCTGRLIITPPPPNRNLAQPRVSSHPGFLRRFCLERVDFLTRSLFPNGTRSPPCRLSLGSPPPSPAPASPSRRSVLLPVLEEDHLRITMGNHVGKRDPSAEKLKNSEAQVEEAENKASPKAANLTQQTSEDNEVFGEADVNQNNGTSTKRTAVTDSKGTADPKNAWKETNPADTTGRPHLVRLFSRDAPGREDNTFKDRPSESDELQTIQEDSTAASENSDLMASQKRSSFRHGSKLATASTIDHARHGSPRRYREPGLLDSLGRFFGGDKHVPRRGKPCQRVYSSKCITSPMFQDYHHAARVSHVSSLPHPRSQHGRYVDDNPVVHFFRNIVSPRTPPPMQGKGGETPKHGYGSGKYYEHKYAHKGHKGYHYDGQGTLSKLFKLGGSGSRPGSRSGSPIARR